MTVDRDSSDERKINRFARQYVWLGSRIHRWAERRSPDCNAGGLSFSQLSGLYIIRNGIQTAGALAKEMQITPRAATSIVDVLLEKGLITRSIDTADRRRAILLPTEAGQQLGKSVEETALLPFDRFLATRSPEEIDALERVLHMMTDFVDTIPSLED